MEMLAAGVPGQSLYSPVFAAAGLAWRLDLRLRELVDERALARAEADEQDEYYDDYYLDGEAGDGLKPYLGLFLELVSPDKVAHVTYSLGLRHGKWCKTKASCAELSTVEGEHFSHGSDSHVSHERLDPETTAAVFEGGGITVEVVLRLSGFVVAASEGDEANEAADHGVVDPSWAALLATGAAADVKLVWPAERQWGLNRSALPAHAAVLAARSPVFAAQLHGPLAVADKAAVPVAPSILRPTLERLLLYAYTGSLTRAVASPSPAAAAGAAAAAAAAAANASPTAAARPWALATPDFSKPPTSGDAQRLLAAGDHYGMPGLVAAAAARLGACLSPDDAADTLLLAEQHGCGALRHEALRFVAGHAGEVMKTEGWKNLVQAAPQLVEAVLATLACGVPPPPPPPAGDAARRVRARVNA